MKEVKEWLWCCNLLLIHAFFGHNHVMFPNKVILKTFVCRFHVIGSFVVGFYENKLTICFSDSFVQKANQQSSGSWIVARNT